MGPPGPECERRELRRPGAVDDHRGRRPGHAPAVRQVRRLRLVGRAVGAGGPRPGRRRRLQARVTPAGTAWSPSSASTSTTSGTAPTSSSRATLSFSRPFASRLFHVLQAGARGEQRAIPAKGLTGPGYDGHTFWDTESFVLPVLTYTAPHAAGDALRWRHAHARARTRARAASSGWRARRSRGARSTAQECSGYWPAGTAAFHINADIADAVVRYRGGQRR